jgi:serine/threonine protein kinase
MKTGIAVGQSIIDQKGTIYRIIAFLGSGTQGEVYEVHGPRGAQALKWYFPSQATDIQCKRLEKLALIGPPNNHYLWPLVVVKDRKIKGFGYVMPLRPKGYRSVVDLMKRTIDPSFSTLIQAASHLVESFRRLHEKGLCYRDISFGNIYINPDSGDIRIGDNDNISSPDDAGGVLGTPRFMAPEIVRGESKPTIQSDLFSLSVLIFYIFFMHHPLEGSKESSIKCFDLPAMKKLYGFDPIFIYDPTRSSNRPVRGVHDNAIIYWAIYPEFFKSTFINAFTTGLKTQGTGRISEEQWKLAFSKLSNSIFHCTCGAENFYDIIQVKNHRRLMPCWNCKKHAELPPRMMIGEEIIALHPQKKVYEHQIFKQASQQFLRPFIEVLSIENKLSIKNATTKVWQIVDVKGVKRTLAGGQEIACDGVAELHFSPEVKALLRNK